MKQWTGLAWIPFFLFFAIPIASASVQTGKPLSARERDHLRHRLESHFNELDLLIRNHSTDRKDVERQKRDMAELKVFERIPIEDEIPSLKSELAETSAKFGLKLELFRSLGKVVPRTRIPREIYVDEEGFRLNPDDTVEKIRLSIRVRGSFENAVRWVESWQTEQMRLVEPTGGFGKRPIRKVAANFWEISAHAFSFREIRHPKLRVRDVKELLPGWAKKDLGSFARSEPMLWSFVTRSQELAPKALPLYPTREEFLLNHARMSLYIEKASPRGAAGAPPHAH